MRLLVCLFLLCPFALGQDNPASSPNPSANSDTQGQSLADVARKLRKDHTQEVQTTPEEARKLLESVGEILSFASEDSGFPKHNQVKSRLVSEKDVENSAREHLAKQEYTQRFARAELTMKKFGLLPREFSLREFLVKATGKQTAAYYDDETKMISLLNWIPAETQAPILAHELTHALQDQNYNLQKWMGREHKPASSSTAKSSQTDSNDDGLTARDAVVEGQAMVVYLDFALAKFGRNLQNTPGLVYQMEDPAVKATPDSELLHDAPMILRETGTFPYRSGLIFEGELLQAGGKPMAFAGAFARPPRSTHEVLQPRAYIDREPLPSLTIPDLRPVVGEKYEVFDKGGIGELDVRAILEQSGNRKIAEGLASAWKGGRYVAFRKLPSTAGPSTTADLALFYVSRWRSPEAAAQFAHVYAGAVTQRYRKVFVQPVPACTGDRCPAFAAYNTTDEGPASIQQFTDNTVIVCEGFDDATASQLRAVWREAPHQTEAENQGWDELSLRLESIPEFAAFQDQIGRQMLQRVLEAAKP